MPASATAAYPSATGTPMDLQIRAVLEDPAVARAHWGIAVTAMDGTPVYGLDEGKLFRPASTAKLFTTAAAMALLGPDTRFNTSIYGTLNPATGTVKGDLVIVGGGDPSFGTADLPSLPGGSPASTMGDLQDLAGQLISKGVHSVTGNIVGDDDLFAPEGPPEGWAAEDLPWGYGALPSALSIGDNQLRLTVRPQAATRSAAGSAAAVLQLDQAVPFFQLANNVATELPEAGAKDHIDVQPVPGHPRELAVIGNISPGAPPATEHVAVSDPALYTAEALRSALSGRQVRVAGRATAWHSVSAAPQAFLPALRAPQDCESAVAQGVACSLECSTLRHPGQLLAQHTSAPLSADVQYTLKTSANLHAEIFLRQLEAHLTCGNASTLGGARLLRAWLLQAGLADQDFVLYDGSGLSTKDLVTPRAEAQLLAFAATQPWFPAWKAGLPTAGVDGTLAGRFTHSPLKGKLFAKTGTLGESRALAGFVQCGSGREMIVAILVDNHDPGSSADRAAMDKVIETIAALN